MKKKLFVFMVFTFFLSSLSLANGGDVFSGKWGWKNENAIFTVELWQESDILRGKYCAIAHDGNRIDCSSGGEKDINIFGTIKDNVAIVHVFSYYGRGMGEPGSCMGKAKLVLDDDKIEWTIIETPYFYWGPSNIFLEKE